VSTDLHPIQSLVWDDFTAEPAHAYTYVFHPLAGTPKNLDRSRAAVSIDIRTEPLIGETHDVFFNRGVASSQAYARRFLNLSPSDQPSQRKRREALKRLSRDLDEAMLRCIRSARRGDAIRGCFYEFTYAPVLAALAAAIKRGVDVKLVVDCKVNEHTVNEKQPTAR
jgi:phosphatidylserine/phosphatidylglycerophosphate/cardiolipin synthase-like enzyme